PSASSRATQEKYYASCLSPLTAIWKQRTGRYSTKANAVSDFDTAKMRRQRNHLESRNNNRAAACTRWLFTAIVTVIALVLLRAYLHFFRTAGERQAIARLEDSLREVTARIEQLAQRRQDMRKEPSAIQLHAAGGERAAVGGIGLSDVAALAGRPVVLGVAQSADGAHVAAVREGPGPGWANEPDGHRILKLSDADFRNTPVDVLASWYSSDECDDDFGNGLLRRWRATRAECCRPDGRT
ncbi:unnamed protein product, partial [Phaeothamnion confervicola]